MLLCFRSLGCLAKHNFYKWYYFSLGIHLLSQFQSSYHYYMETSSCEAILGLYVFLFIGCNTFLKFISRHLTEMESIRHINSHLFYFLWEHKYTRSYENICEQFIMPLHTIIHKQQTKFMSNESFKVLIDISDWYLMNVYSSLRIYGGSQPSNIFPLFVTKKVNL